MKLAAISDIHGNLLALEAVLEDIEKHNLDAVRFVRKRGVNA
ncbi:metallophosphatase family protein [Cronobacter turicensis]|nr:metallophosphatase family protein [Cronobacter turicensis]